MATLDRPLDGAAGAGGSSALPNLGWIAGGSSVPRTVLLGLVLAVLGALGVLQVLQTSQVANLGDELSALDYERTQLQAEIRQLEVAIANEGTRAAALDRAERNLDMVPAEPVFRISVDEVAPAGITVPSRFIQPPEPVAVAAIGESAWWERLLAQLLGAQ